MSLQFHPPSMGRKNFGRRVRLAKLFVVLSSCENLGSRYKDGLIDRAPTPYRTDHLFTRVVSRKMANLTVHQLQLPPRFIFGFQGWLVGSILF